METQEDYFTPVQAAHRLRVDYRTITRWIKTGLLEAETIQEGKRVRHHIKRSTLEAIEQRGKHRSLV